MLSVLGLAAGLSWMSLQSLPGEPERRLTVGLYQNAPKIYTDEGGDPAGLFPALLRRIAAEENWALTFVECAWEQCLQQLQAGELDLMPDVAESADRRERMAFHEVPVVQAWSQLYVVTGADVHGPDDLAGQDVAVLRGSVQHEHLRRWQEDDGHTFNVIPMESLDEGFRRAADGTVTAAVANNFFGSRHAQDAGLVETSVTFGLTNLYYAAPLDGDPAVLEVLDDWLTEWKAEPDSPYYQVLRDTTAAPGSRGIPPWLLPALALSIGAAVFAGGLAWLLRWEVQRRTRELRESTKRLQRVLDSSPVILYSLRGPELEPDWVSGNIERILGYRRDEVMQPGWWEGHVHPDDLEAVQAEREQLAQRGELVQEYRVLDANGGQRHVLDEKQVVEAATDGTPLQVIGSWTDLTESREQQARVHSLANYDGTTGLPNRTLLQQRVDEAMDTAQTGQSGCTLVLLDLDRFKSVNETLGMGAGDELLQAVGRRLQGLARPGDTVARIGSDTFAVLLLSIGNTLALTHWLDELLEAFRQPLSIAGHELILTASVGVAGYPRDGTRRDELVTGAELAVENARDQGGDRWITYEPSLGERSSRRLFLENHLRQAVAGGEFVLYYQPQYDLASGQLVGVEALVRWQHPERGVVPPDEFIPLAEETGLIHAIDRWVLTESCRQLAAWDAQGSQVPRVALNLSAREFYDGELVPRLQQLLVEYGLNAGRFEMEITETMLMRYPERARPVLQQLADLGVHLAMDDFGTGYSNLALLEELPLDRLKIDRALVWEIGKGERKESIVRAIVAMGRALGLELVAEGIERQEQRKFLVAEGCQLGQGFHLARPAPVEALALDDVGSLRLSGHGETP